MAFKETFTWDEITKAFPTTFTAKEQKYIKDIFLDSMSFEDAVKIITDTADALAKTGEKFNTLDRIVYAVRNAYVTGAVYGTMVTTKYCIASFIELQGQKPDLALIDAIADGSITLKREGSVFNAV